VSSSAYPLVMIGVIENTSDSTALAEGLYRGWIRYPILCWCWCPEIGNSSIDLAQLSRFLLEDGDRTPSPNRRVLNKKQDNG
jgi:hypothetical protein